MNDLRKNIRHIFVVFVLLFTGLCVYFAYFVFFLSPSEMTSSYNPRMQVEYNDVKRGDILDNSGTVLAESVENDNGTYSRTYPYGEDFAHVVGYDSMGGAGLEMSYNFDLENVNLELVQRIANMVAGIPITGDSVVTTLDADLQEYCCELLGNQKGAIVVEEPSTGKILAMVSNPTFDPNSIQNEDYWNSLINDTDNSPLLNRATQGLYPPGSVFKILTAASAYEYLPDYDTFTYDCSGEETFGDRTIHCFDNEAHGEEDIVDAFTASCNTFFATIGSKVGPENLSSVCSRALFNEDIDFDIPTSQSRFTLPADASASQIAETSFGQGETLVTPLHMAMITSAVADGGTMMQPYLVDHETTYSGRDIKKNMPQKLTTLFSADEAQWLTGMMTSVIENGTGTAAKVSGVSVAGKTGTAQNSSGADHGWFVCFAPTDNPQLVISIITENSNGPHAADVDASKIISHYLSE